MLKIIFSLSLATIVYAGSGAYSIPLTDAEIQELSKVERGESVTTHSSSSVNPGSESAGNSDLVIAMDALEKGDFKTAFVHFQTAAKQGNTIAQQNLAVLYNNGIGVKQDRERASYWIEQSARGGDRSKVALR
ncbi:MAG: hypothetical protein DSZ05_06160 [Sulfurospirillum sp.]|nr:MAG: hypothetical protein DSZ05_06160 [Sulfurospirillum sp.]